jgi:DNA-directed RNA polymerase specialized sigma24 family protein
MADPAAVLEAERPRLLGLAYRLLGSASDAGDVVQDSFLRRTRADQATVTASAVLVVTQAGRAAGRRPGNARSVAP